MKIKTQILFCLLIILIKPTYAQWKKVDSKTHIRLVDLCFINKNTGFCVGGDDEYGNGKGNGIILRSHDGGLSWAKVYEDSFLSVNDVVALNNIIYCFGKKNGVPVGIISKDSGSTWKIIYNIFGITTSIQSVQVSNNNIYFLSGSDLVKVTNDSSKIILSHIALYDIDNLDKIVALNDQVTQINESKNEGNSWNLISVNNFSKISGNSMTYSCMKSNGDSISIYGTYPNVLLSTQNGGKDWKIQDISFYRVFFLTSNIIYTYNSKNFYKSKDGGSSFQIESPEIGAIENVYEFYNVGFICGINGFLMRNAHIN